MYGSDTYPKAGKKKSCCSIGGGQPGAVNATPCLHATKNGSGWIEGKMLGLGTMLLEKVEGGVLYRSRQLGQPPPPVTGFLLNRVEAPNFSI